MTSHQSTGPRLYEIRIAGHLDSRWDAWFDGMTLTARQDGTTVASGVITDQAALHGVLQKLRDAGLPLISITQPPDKEQTMTTHAPTAAPTTTATTMRAAVHHRFGGPEVIEIAELARPVPAADEILISVRATTVSAADHRSRSRDVPAGLLIPSSLVLGFVKPRRPILGMDVAGVVVAVGEHVERVRPGDEVLAMLGARFGGHAEYAIAKASDAIALKPSAMSFEEAVSLVFGGITAQGYLNQASIGHGTSVLVNGASGAVGSAVVQLAKAAGAQVTGVCSAANSALVASLGAARTIDYATQDFAQDGAKYDVIVDCVGNAPVSRVLHSLNPGGAVLLVAGDLRSIVAGPGQSRKHRITVATGPGPYRSEDLQLVLDLAQRGLVRPTIDRTFPFEQIAAAHEYVDGGHKRGSVVVSVGAPQQVECAGGEK
jgi:NADPH:quinone reductase-like Zn-dependent oxidoreductase